MPESSASNYAQTPGPGAGKVVPPAIRETKTACFDTEQQRFSHGHASPLGETRKRKGTVQRYRYVREKFGGKM